MSNWGLLAYIYIFFGELLNSEKIKLILSTQIPNDMFNKLF